ncbi:uncharacterized protein LOC105199243 [Solenopsis invicta]|uniref:uncharacterized protein LOC105199243 n=1 Tax=Solenopsis invicta TaxID=13686 RepID=UPI000595C4A5|nr:uncharacterized protein LOC105199243 [Solenopsis invicta]
MCPWWEFGLYRLGVNKIFQLFFIAVPMETRVRGFSSVLGILLLFACFSSRTDARINRERLKQELVALENVLNYVGDRSEQMNVDVILGITLAQANLMAVVTHRNTLCLECEFINNLKELNRLSNKIRIKLINTVFMKDEAILKLFNPRLWMKFISWASLFWKLRPNYSQPLNYWDIIKLIRHGTPNETESDKCLFEILYSSYKMECKIPVHCIEILMKEDDTTGYPLLHRLLIVQVAKALHCKEAEQLSSLIPEYCAKIYRDLVNLELWNFPVVTRDLMMEQVVLCGNEGYLEFVDEYYENAILNWAHWSGCFGVFRYTDVHKITRRSSSTIDYGCESHTTGLAAATLSVFIRKNIEYAYCEIL